MRIETFLLLLIGGAFFGFSLFLIAQVPHMLKDLKRYDMSTAATVTGNIQNTDSWLYHPVLSYYANGTTHVVNCKEGFTQPKKEGASIKILYVSDNPNEIHIVKRAWALKLFLSLALWFLTGLRMILIGISMMS